MITKKQITLFVAIVSMVLASAGYFYWQKQQSTAEIPEYLQGIGGDFSLQSADGPVSLKDFRGKVVLLFFGYTNCPDICPLTLSNWSSAFEKLSAEELQNVRGLFISVDPGRDTQEVLKQYTAYFHPNITGITGAHEELAKLADIYRADFHLENEGKSKDYLVEHSSFVYVVDQQGKVRDLLSHDSTPKDITKSLRKIL